MSWELTESYQQFVEMHPELKESKNREAFHKFVTRMWTQPSTFIEFAQAYMEFTTPQKLTFPKLQALVPMANADQATQRSRKSHQRSSRKRKKTRAES